MRQLEKIARKRDRDRRHPPGLDDEQQHPAVNEGHRRMQRLAQIRILATDDGQARGQFRINKSAGQRDQAAHDPRAEDERRCVDPLGDEIGIDENARADNAAHHRHRRAEKAEAAGELAALVRRSFQLRNSLLLWTSPFGFHFPSSSHHLERRAVGTEGMECSAEV